MTGHAHVGPTSGHGHGHGPAPDVAVPLRSRVVLLAVLAAVAVATVVGVVLLWPSSAKLHDVRSHASFSGPGVTFPDATIVSLSPTCLAGGAAPAGASRCDSLDVRVDDGTDKGTTTQVGVPHEVMASGVSAGSHVQLIRTPASDGRPTAFAFFTVRRGLPLGWLALAFAVLVIAVARVRGLMAMISLGLGGVALWKFTLPALLTGESGTQVALVTAGAVMFVVLYATHGLSLRTSAALAGTLAGIGTTALLGLLVIDRGHLTGVADETGGFLSSAAGSLDFQGLLSCGIIVAGLGVLNDVTITQASAVWELREAAPTMSRRRVFAGAMRIGRDHIASTIYTVVFAYAGTALLTLLLLVVYDRPLLDLLSTEDLADEVARTLTSGIGLVLAVPLTTVIAALVAAPSRGEAQPAAGRRRATGRRGLRRSPDWDLERDGAAPAPGRRRADVPVEE